METARMRIFRSGAWNAGRVMRLIAEWAVLATILTHLAHADDFELDLASRGALDKTCPNKPRRGLFGRRCDEVPRLAGEFVEIPDNLTPVIEYNRTPCGNCCGAGTGAGAAACQPCTPGSPGSPPQVSPSPGAGTCPSPCGQYRERNGRCTDNSKFLSPLIFQECAQYRMEFLRRHGWELLSPKYNWFYNPELSIGETPCQVFKLANSGIDVIVFRPDSPEPICSTISNVHEYRLFNVINANSCSCLREENYLETQTRTVYARNIVSACGMMRTIVLSKANDEFPPGFNCRLVRNPCRPYRPRQPCGNSTVAESDSSE